MSPVDDDIQEILDWLDNGGGGRFWTTYRVIAYALWRMNQPASCTRPNWEVTTDIESCIKSCARIIPRDTYNWMLDDDPH